MNWWIIYFKNGLTLYPDDIVKWPSILLTTTCVCEGYVINVSASLVVKQQQHRFESDLIIYSIFNNAVYIRCFFFFVPEKLVKLTRTVLPPTHASPFKPNESFLWLSWWMDEWMNTKSLEEFQLVTSKQHREPLIIVNNMNSDVWSEWI